MILNACKDKRNKKAANDLVYGFYSFWNKKTILKNRPDVETLLVVKSRPFIPIPEVIEFNRWQKNLMLDKAV